MTPLRRAFADLPHGQIHYRTAAGVTETVTCPLVMLHASPGSSKQLAVLASDLARDRTVVLPDTPGNGDSTALPLDAPAIADYAAHVIAFLDAIGLNRVDLYGSHTGASIAAECALLFPDRVRRVILDGIGIYTDEEREARLAHYAPPFHPEDSGAYLIRAYHFCRDQALFFPWYDKSRAARRDRGLSSPAMLHDLFVEVMKAPLTYPQGYHAAFSYRAEERLPGLTRPTLIVAAEDDPLHASSAALVTRTGAAEFASMPRGDAADFRETRQRLFTDFLNR